MTHTTFLLTLVTGIAISASVYAQGSLQDYRRADAFGQRFQGLVTGQRVQVHWTHQGSGLWLRVPVPGGHRYRQVDMAAGTLRDLFDHQQLAQALSAASDQTVDAARLPLQSLQIDDHGKLRFRHAGQSWSFDPQNGKLSSAAPPDASRGTTVEVLGRPRASRQTGDHTNILFVNQTDQSLHLHWIDPDGRRVAYGALRPGSERAQHTYARHVWVVTDEANQLRGAYRATASPGVAVVDGAWQARQERPRGSRPGDAMRSPDGRWRAEVSDSQVILHPTQAGESVTLVHGEWLSRTQQGNFLPRLFWSPDSTRLAVLHQLPVEQRQVTVIESSPADQFQPKPHTFDYTKPGDPLPRTRIALFDIATQQPIRVENNLFANPFDLTDFAWSPDSTEFSFLYNQRGHQMLRLVGIHAGTGQTRSIIDETSDTFVCYSQKTYLHRLPDSGEAIWMSERDGWNHLYLIDTSEGQVKNAITTGPWVVRGVERVDTQLRQVWFTAGGIHPEQDPYHVHHCRVNFDGTGLTLLTTGDGTHALEYSPDGQLYVDRYSRVDLPPVAELRRSHDGSLVTQLHQTDWAPLLEAGWQPPVRFVAKARDGQTDIYGHLYRPSNFDPEKKYPVIENIYAGPHSAHVPKSFAVEHGGQSLAELGFVVVRIDGLGTSHRSKAFHDVCWKNLADAGFPDRVRWIQSAAEKYPWIDPTRVGIYGGSAGGQNALRALIDHGDFYDCAVADCGCHDNRMDKIWWNEQWMGWPVDESYAKSSNVEHAHRMQGKLLLTVGELDRNVDPASTMQVANALIKADKDFELIVFPSAGHGAGSSPYGTRRMRDFFVRELLEVTPRWGS